MVNAVVMACVIIIGMFNEVDGIQILSKSKLEKCEKTSDSGNLNCSTKIVLNLAVPSGSVSLLTPIYVRFVVLYVFVSSLVFCVRFCKEWRRSFYCSGDCGG